MSIDSEAMVWFLMRAAYGQEGKAKDYLESKGIETFLPLTEKSYICRGKVRHKQVSLIPNFLFVKSNEKEMKKYVGKGDLTFFHITMFLIKMSKVRILVKKELSLW